MRRGRNAARSRTCGWRRHAAAQSPAARACAGGGDRTVDECDLIYRMIALCRPERAVEVGMAYGVSSLCIADALSRDGREAPAPRLVSIDPAQAAWGYGGVQLLRRATLDHAFRLIEKP